jgi:4-hydroxy-tetrahydrodipicolinate synthase
MASVVAITVTPFDAAGDLDAQGYARVLEHCLSGGVGVLTPHGNTSEFYSLSPAERSSAVELTVSTAAGRATVLAGVGHDTDTAVRDARHAARAGVDGIMVHQPVHPYQSVGGWVDYHRRIADAVPDLGVVCYVRNPRITAAAFAALAATCPNVVGVKYAVADPLALTDLVERDAGRLAWCCGLAESWAPFFRLAGAQGFTSGLANVAPRQSMRLLAALDRDDTGEAMAVMRLLRPFEDLRAHDASAWNVSVVKEALAQLSLCRPDVRPPIEPLGSAHRSQVTEILSALVS